MWYGMVLYGMVCMYVCIYIYMWWTSVDYTLWSSHLVWMLENLPVSRSMIFLLRAGCQEHPPLSALVSDTGAAIVFRYPPAIKRGSEILNKWRFLAGKITHTHTYIHIYIYMWVFNCHVFKRPTTGRLTLTIGYMDGETPPASRASINLDTWPI